MYAIFKTGGQQFTVSKGDEILVDLLSVEKGGEVKFEDVLLIGGDAGTKIGTPKVDGASVVGVVLDQVKGEKIRTVFFRRRKDSRTVKGHRQKYLKVKITDIVGA